MEGVEVITATAFAAELVRSGVLKPQKISCKASLQEPVKLTRGLEEVQPLLNLIQAMGIEHIPLFLHGKLSRCVSTPLMDCYDPDVARHMVEVRLDDARRIGSPAILTASADDSYLMSKYASGNIQIIDIFQLLDNNC